MTEAEIKKRRLRLEESIDLFDETLKMELKDRMYAKTRLASDYRAFKDVARETDSFDQMVLRKAAVRLA